MQIYIFPRINKAFIHSFIHSFIQPNCSHFKTSDFAPALSKAFLDIQANIERGFTLKRVRDMIRIYSQCPGILNENNIEPEHPLVFDSEIPISINNIVDQPEKRNLKVLTNIRLNNRNRPITIQLNINSIRNKFDFSYSEISPSLDLLLVSETKLDDSFPMAQFLMSGFCKPYRLDRCSNGGGLMIYIRENIRCRLLTEYKPPENIECSFVEIVL